MSDVTTPPGTVRFIRRLQPAAIAVVATMTALAMASCGGDDSGGEQLSGAAGRGQQLAEERGCTTCHSASGDSGTGPSWQGVWGTTVELEGGNTATFDREYFARSVRDPQAQVVEGFNVEMPTVDLSDAEIDDLVVYLEALGSTDADDRSGNLSSEG